MVGIQSEDSSFKENTEKRIYRTEFMKIFEVYELWKYETRFSIFFNDTAEAVDQIAVAQAQTRKQDNETKLKQRNQLVKVLQNIVRSITYEYILNVIAIL